MTCCIKPGVEDCARRAEDEMDEACASTRSSLDRMTFADALDRCMQ